MSVATYFQTSLLKWFAQHGRKNLPWQKNKTPYRVWVSEIMLQQTQVSTVIDYYEKFLQRFPTLKSLANASEDDVLHLWSGLGYYSRARNLHRTAQTIMKEHAGEFPNNFDEIQKLSGIGPSTAGAILAIAFNQRAAILDGNVKRVLARFHGINEPINEKNTENKLWELANQFTPKKNVADYTQAIMDLGATICTRSKPQCRVCPLKNKCVAFKKDIVELIPRKKLSQKIPTRVATFLILYHEEKVLLCKRPSIGIWGGLWSFPEIPGNPHEEMLHAYCRKHFGTTITNMQILKNFRHTFSHYHLEICPIKLIIKKRPVKVMEEGRQIWYNLNQNKAIGLPKPVQMIMRGLL